MAVNSENARIFGSDSDAIYLAPLGTPLPASIDAPLDPAFEDIGWIDDEGITETLSGSKSVIRGHQGAGIVRTLMTESGTTIKFTGLESKPLTKKLRYNEKEITASTPGIRKVKRGPGQRVTPLVAVIDLFDADDETIKERTVIERFEVVPTGDRVAIASDIAGFPFEGEIIGDYITYEGDGLGPTSDKWTVTIEGAPTGGTYTLTVNGSTTAPIAHNAAASAVAAAINALSGVTGISGVTATGTVALTFPSAVALAGNGAGLTGGTAPSVTVAQTP